MRSFQYPVLRLLAAWLAENAPEWLLSQGECVFRNATLPMRELREATMKLLGPTRTKIQRALRDGWKSKDGSWVDAYHARTLREVARSLDLKADPFSLVGDDET